MIRWLTEIDRTAIHEVGGKGANLGEMTRAGLPVPPAFVVTTAAYRAHIEAAGLPERIGTILAEDVEAACREIAGSIVAAPMPPAVREQVVTSYRRLQEGGPVRVAVRSSATAEDLPDASFAGQQETFLGVGSEEALLTAVQRCWASLWSPRAVAYRAQMGYDHLGVSLAVVVQAMVAADVAGVMFTANPLTGATDEYLITAAYGLGESVVSGLVTPDTYRIAGDGRLRSAEVGAKEQRIVMADGATVTQDVSAAERRRACLGREQLTALAALGRRVAACYAGPQDIEWAIVAGRLYLLQTRPITTPMAIPYGPAPAGLKGRLMDAIWQNMRDHFPDPPAPMDLEVMAIGHQALWAMYGAVGCRIPPQAAQIVETPEGRMQFRLKGWDPAPTLLWRLPAVIRKAIDEDPLENWTAVRAQAEPLLARLEAVDLDAADEGVAHQVAAAALDGLRDYMPQRFTGVFLPAMLHETKLKWLVRRAVGRDAAGTVTQHLMLTVPHHTAEMNRAIARLAQTAGEHGVDGAPFVSQLGAFLERWGNRTVRGMEALPSYPSWKENPAPVVTMVQAMLVDPSACDAEATARRDAQRFAAARERVLRGLGRRGARAFEQALERTRRYLVAREDSLAFNERYIALIRRALLALGARQAEAGRLRRPEDIFYLRRDELPGVGEPVLERVERRRRAYDAVCAAQERGVHWTVFTGSTPVPARVGGEAPEGALSGFATSPGRVTGAVRVVRGPEDFARLKKGEILVAPMTAPAWTPLFSLAAAVVTDTGGPLSHAAIVAREYGIPAVLGTGSATARLQDGQVVTVDGSAGWVQGQILAHPHKAPQRPESFWHKPLAKGSDQ